VPIVKIEKLVFGGQALGYYNDKPVFVWNALPDEIVEIDIIKQHKGIYEAIAKKIIKSSPDRISAQEDHYLSCSPWQIMTYDAENKYKQLICRDVFNKIDQLPEPEYHFNKNRHGYRNKMEFSLSVENKKTFLALNQRKGHKLVKCQNCILADSAVQKAAAEIITWLNIGQMTNRFLKSLIVRSNGQHETMAVLFVKDRVSFIDPRLKTDNLQSWQIVYSSHRSPASIVSEVLYKQGSEFLTATIGNYKFMFGNDSFLQNNLPMFELTLQSISNEIDGQEVLDMFSGIGAIGINISAKASKIVLVENNKQAKYYADKNIELNNLKNIESVCSFAEDALDQIKSEKIVIVDPPRAGLANKLINRLIEVGPKKIIYLSCNPSTQARDLEKLVVKYQPVSWQIYNYFPATPHIESMFVLVLK
jgi:23S rRNA (uracil1939-C5)-methyltransferase